MSLTKVNYNEVADYFIATGNVHGDVLTSLKLQKLLYYAQAWHLTGLGDRLFEGNFEAWVHGPVLPQLYADYRLQYYNPIIKDIGQGYLNTFEAKLDKKQIKLLNEVVEAYFGCSAFELERLTHNETPWLRARNGLPADTLSSEIIKDEWMIDYYKQFWIEE